MSVCVDCNHYIAGMMRQHQFLSEVVDKLTTDDGTNVVSDNSRLIDSYSSVVFAKSPVAVEIQ